MLHDLIARPDRGTTAAPPAPRVPVGHRAPTVSVCMCVTRPATVAAAVRSIAGQTYVRWELVVVAQGDVDGIRAAVAGALPDPARLRFVAQEGRGLSRARNAAVAAATGEVIAFLDDDCEAAPDWLAVIVDRFTRHPAVGLVGGAVVAPPPTVRWPRNCPSCAPAEAIHDPADGGARPPGWTWIGANFALRRSTAMLVGDFDELLGAGARFPVAEEMDYMFRAERLRIPMLTTPEAVVRHTYGWRQGVPAVWRLQRNYARGNGALAAKLTMRGDPRGRASLVEMRRLAREDWLRRRRPVALPAGLRRLYHFVAGYRRCLREYAVGPRDVLVPRGMSDV